MKKIFFTDLTFHTKEHRPTASLDKAVQKPHPRFYVPNTDSGDMKVKADGSFEIAITLPPDVMEGVKKGEIELVMPENGAPIFAGKDTVEKIRQMQEKKRREIIHSGRVWRKEGI